MGNMHKINGQYDAVEQVMCPDGVRRYLRVTTPEVVHINCSHTIRGSVQYLNKTVAGDAVSLGCGDYFFEPDPKLKNGKLFGYTKLLHGGG